MWHEMKFDMKWYKKSLNGFWSVVLFLWASKVEKLGVLLSRFEKSFMNQDFSEILNAPIFFVFEDRGLVFGMLTFFLHTRILGPYGPFILAPAEGCFGGPSARHLGLWPNNLFQPPKDHILKVSWHYIHFCLKYKHLKNQAYKQGYKQGYAQWVILEILDVLCRHQWSYPESSVALSSFLAEI